MAPAAPLLSVPARPHRLSPAFVALLGTMTALGAFTTDTYLPSLPAVGLDLGASPAATQLTISGTLIGGALGQLVIGPLSDRFGRRRPALIGIGGHIVASLLCVIAGGIVPLIGLRVLQGVGNSAAGVVAMAGMRQRYTGCAPRADSALAQPRRARKGGARRGRRGGPAARKSRVQPREMRRRRRPRRERKAVRRHRIALERRRPLGRGARERPPRP